MIEQPRYDRCENFCFGGCPYKNNPTLIFDIPGLDIHDFALLEDPKKLNIYCKQCTEFFAKED